MNKMLSSQTVLIKHHSLSSIDNLPRQSEKQVAEREPPIKIRWANKGIWEAKALQRPPPFSSPRLSASIVWQSTSSLNHPLPTAIWVRMNTYFFTELIFAKIHTKLLVGHAFCTWCVTYSLNFCWFHPQTHIFRIWLLMTTIRCQAQPSGFWQIVREYWTMVRLENLPYFKRLLLSSKDRILKTLPESLAPLLWSRLLKDSSLPWLQLISGVRLGQTVKWGSNWDDLREA